LSYFYLSAAGLVIVALLFVVFPLLRQKKLNSIELSNANVIKQRIEELNREVEEGLIDENEKEAAINDLKLALVDETPDVDVSLSTAKKNNLGVFILLALPALAIGAWVYWDANQISGLAEYKQSQQDVIAIREQMQNNGGESLTPNDFAKLALSIRRSLRENPDDAQGWSYLGLVNTSIGRVEEGVAAYEKAIDLTPQDDQLRFKYAETLMLAGSEDSLGNAKRQLSYLINKTPENRNYRLLLTTVAIQLQDPDLALFNFNQIKDFLKPDSQFYQSLVAGLEGLGLQIEDGNQLAGPAATTVDETVTTANELLIQINISNELESKLPEDAYLIVFAQQQSGASRAPLAVKRFKLPALPVQISLSNNDAMIPSFNLGTADSVKLTARISLDEDVMPSQGELEGSIENIDVSAASGQLLNITISKEL